MDEALRFPEAVKLKEERQGHSPTITRSCSKRSRYPCVAEDTNNLVPKEQARNKMWCRGPGM
jgi:hypothetical protein